MRSLPTRSTWASELTERSAISCCVMSGLDEGLDSSCDAKHVNSTAKGLWEQGFRSPSRSESDRFRHGQHVTPWKTAARSAGQFLACAGCCCGAKAVNSDIGVVVPSSSSRNACPLHRIE